VPYIFQSDLLFFTLIFQTARGEKSFLLFSVHLLSLFLCDVLCPITKPRGSSSAYLWSQLFFKMRLSSLVVGTLSTLLSDEMEGARTYYILSLHHIRFRFLRPVSAAESCSLFNSHTHGEPSEPSESGPGLLVIPQAYYTNSYTHTRTNTHKR
jgi:hypothetical protein